MKTEPQNAEGDDSEFHLTEAPREVTDVPDGPPPSDKVDFENLPEFVWQRTMLKTVRLIAIFVALAITIALLIAFFGMGKGAHDSLKPIIEGEQPVAPPQP